MSRQPATYEPINRLKPVADDVWIVDGPVIEFGPAFLKMPFPTRMTIIRLRDRQLFIHSPTPLTPDLRAAIDGIGRPRWLVAPNRLHYWWVPDWHAAFPGAQLYLAPRVIEQGGSRIDDLPHRPLRDATGYEWDAEVETLPVEGRYLTEFVFFHRASCTLVLTDLIESFEPQRLKLWMRWLAWVGGVQEPGGMPRDMRLTFSRSRLKACVETMLGWNPARVIFAHGKWYEDDGAARLRRAFRSVLG
jgi:hypothetical protein